MSTRRKFLLNCSTLATATVVTPLRAFSGMLDFTPTPATSEDLSFAKFAAQVNTMFQVHAAPGRVVRLKLVEASLDRARPQHGRRAAPDANNERFSLVFSGPRGELLPQEIFVMEHSKLGRMDLLLVPIFTRNPQKMDYEVVFNRLHSTQNTG